VTTWSGIDALDLLQSKKFDFLLVDDYLPDMYIGNLLERVSLLPVRPEIWVMKAEPAEGVCTYGSLSFSAVEKKGGDPSLQAVRCRYQRRYSGSELSETLDKRRERPGRMN
jgi:hypothetical protein